VREQVVKGKQQCQIRREGMIAPNQNSWEVESEPVNNSVADVPVKIGTLTLIKQHHLQPNHRG